MGGQAGLCRVSLGLLWTETMAAITSTFFCHEYFRKQTVAQLLILPPYQLTPQKWLKADTVVVDKGKKVAKTGVL